jgi:hypothetical protein
VNTTNYVVNCSLSRTNQGFKTPQELWSRNKPYVGHLNFFGCVVHALVLDPTKKKFDLRTKLCRLLGFDLHTKAYRLFNPRSKKVILNQDVKFDKTHIGPGVEEQGVILSE